MVQHNLAPVVVPLVILLVLKMSDICRETNLYTIDRNSWSPIVVPTRLVEDFGLGRFPILHGMNAIIIWGLYFYALGSSMSGAIITSELHAAIAFLVAIFLVILPLFEIQNYDQSELDESLGIPPSLKFWSSNIAMCLIFSTIFVFTRGLVQNSTNLTQNLIFILIAISAFLLSTGFWSGANLSFFRDLAHEVE